MAAVVGRALAEDIGDGDLTAQLVPAEAKATATIITREPCVVCGRPYFDEAMRQVGRPAGPVRAPSTDVPESDHDLIAAAVARWRIGVPR